MAKKKKKQKKQITVIGRRETVDFPALNLFGIIAKIDTGAFTTAIHCHEIKKFVQDGKEILCFRLSDPNHPENDQLIHQFTDFTEKNIKNSFGDYEKRFIITTQIKLGNRKIKSTVSLANRGNMRYPVLIGRKLIGKKFLVDVSKINLISSVK